MMRCGCWPLANSFRPELTLSYWEEISTQCGRQSLEGRFLVRCRTRIFLLPWQFQTELRYHPVLETRLNQKHPAGLLDASDEIRKPLPGKEGGVGRATTAPPHIPFRMRFRLNLLRSPPTTSTLLTSMKGTSSQLVPASDPSVTAPSRQSSIPQSGSSIAPFFTIARTLPNREAGRGVRSCMVSCVPVPRRLRIRARPRKLESSSRG